VELPDDILRKAREQAEREGLDLDRFISTVIIRFVVAQTAASGQMPRGSRVNLPLIKTKGKGPLEVPDDIMAVSEGEEDRARHAASVRR
jgi:hypothetical protein